jgi:hypothetical protein
MNSKPKSNAHAAGSSRTVRTYSALEVAKKIVLDRQVDSHIIIESKETKNTEKK